MAARRAVEEGVLGAALGLARRRDPPRHAGVQPRVLLGLLGLVGHLECAERRLPAAGLGAHAELVVGVRLVGDLLRGAVPDVGEDAPDLEKGY